MYSFKVNHMSILCVFLLKFGKSVAGPAQISSILQEASVVEQHEWTSVLSSIDSRLKSLDDLYTSQLTPTLENRLEQIQSRVSGMEVKLLRVEALLNSKLDRMTDNISSRHFRDDMIQTDLFRKIENAYDGITHRLAYMDKKSDTGLFKMQERTQAVINQLKDIDDVFKIKHDSVQSEMSNCVKGLDDIKTSFNNSENQLLLSLGRYTNISLMRQEEMGNSTQKKLLSKLTDTMVIVRENVTKSYDILRRKMNFHISMTNSTDKKMETFSKDLGIILNEYASKVSDIGAQVMKSDKKIATHLGTIETVANSTRNEMQNGMRTLMIQVGKVSHKEKNYDEVIDQRFLSDMEEKIDSNFGKIISTQNTFLESCHRLQMDESQLENQISDILNKLIDKFERTNRDQFHLLKKIEVLLMKHEDRSKRELYDANENIRSIFEQNKKGSNTVIGHLQHTGNNLETLLVLVQSILNNNNTNVKREVRKEKSHQEYIEALEKVLNYTKKEQMEMFKAYNVSIRTFLSLAQMKENETESTHFIIKTVSKNIDEFKQIFKNATRSLDNMTSEIWSSVQKTYESVKENNQNLHKLIRYWNTTEQTITNKNPNVTKNKQATNFSDIDDIVKEIFFNNLETTTEITEISCLDMDIDVRYENDKVFKACKNQTTIFETSANQNSETNDCLDFDIDVRFSKNDNATVPQRSARCQKDNSTQHETTTQLENETGSDSTTQTITTKSSFTDFNIDAKFDQDKNSNGNVKRCENVTTPSNSTDQPLIEKPISIEVPTSKNSSDVKNSSQETMSTVKLPENQK